MPGTILLYSFALVGALLALSTLIARLATHPPRLQFNRTAADYGLEAERIEFPSVDGLRLSGWWIPGTNGATIVLCHGFVKSHHMMLKYARFLHHAGFNTIVFDFRGHGASEGEHTTIGFHEPADLLGAVKLAKSKCAGPIGVFGISMGAAVVVRTAAVCEEIRAVVAVDCFARVRWAAWSYMATFLGPLALLVGAPALWLGERMIGVNLGLNAPVELVGRIAPRPLLLVHCGRDTMVPGFHTRQLYAAAGEPKQQLTIPRAWHGSPYQFGGEAFQRRVVEFFRASLLGGNSSYGSVGPDSQMPKQEAVLVLRIRRTGG